MKLAGPFHMMTDTLGAGLRDPVQPRPVVSEGGIEMAHVSGTYFKRKYEPKTVELVHGLDMVLSPTYFQTSRSLRREVDDKPSEMHGLLQKN